MKKEELEKRLKENKQERKQLKQQLKDLPSLEVGKWYKDCNEWLGFYDGANFIYGFSTGGNWYSDSSIYTVTERERPATDKEVEEALIKEAKRRGLIDGVSVLNEYGKLDKVGNYTWYENGIFHSNGYAHWIELMKDGKWAQIIEQPKEIKLCAGYYTKIQLKDLINNRF